MGQQLNNFKEWYPHMPEKQEINGKLIERLKGSQNRYALLQLIKALQIKNIIGESIMIINYPSVNLHYNWRWLIIRTNQGKVQLNQWNDFINR